MIFRAKFHKLPQHVLLKIELTRAEFSGGKPVSTTGAYHQIYHFFWVHTIEFYF